MARCSGPGAALGMALRILKQLSGRLSPRPRTSPRSRPQPPILLVWICRFSRIVMFAASWAYTARLVPTPVSATATNPVTMPRTLIASTPIRPAQAGRGWQARELSESGFERDTRGERPHSSRPSRGPDGDGEEAMMASVAAGRFLVAVVPRGRDRHRRARPRPRPERDAMVSLDRPDGRRALPAFTRTAELAAWNPAARFVGHRRHARRGGRQRRLRCPLVLDLGQPHARELRSSHVWASRCSGLASPEKDPFVADAGRGRGRAEEAVTGICDVCRRPPGRSGRNADPRSGPVRGRGPGHEGGGDSPPTGSSARASTGSPSASAVDRTARRFVGGAT